MDFNGSNIAEKIDVSANGSRVRLTRNVAAITMDFAGIEGLNVRTLGGADTVTVNDLTGTDLDSANVDLSAFDGTGDGAADTVIANGTDAADDVDVSSDAGKDVVSRASTQGERHRRRADARQRQRRHARRRRHDRPPASTSPATTPVTVDGGDGRRHHHLQRHAAPTTRSASPATAHAVAVVHARPRA